MKRKRQLITPGKAAAKIAGLYLLVGVLWILLSDRLLLGLIPDPERLTLLQNYKGWVFIIVTAAGLFWLIARLLRSNNNAQEKLRRMSERLRLAVEGSGECVWDLDLASNTVAFSGELKDVFEPMHNSFKGMPRDWKDMIHPDDFGRVSAAMQSVLEEKTPVYECEYRLRAKDGNWRWIAARGIIVERDRAGTPCAMAGTLADITARKNSDELAWRYANLDVLTGLPNRRLFHEKLEFELRKSKRAQERLAILFIDLDGFKGINDLYGHESGDLLLLEAGHRLAQCVREADIVARLGGDEFVVTLTQLTDQDHAEFVCQKILSSLSSPFFLGREVCYVSCSIGISLHPLDGAHTEELIRKADHAMYAAKRAGKNQFHYFTKEMDDEAHGRLLIANELRHAMEGQQLTVHYQPVVNLADGKIVKAEALLRWRHPSLGDIAPSEFIPMAEETGLIRQIGNWVFMEAADFCKACNEQTGKPFQISVNKSPVQFMGRDADDGWLAYLSERGIAADSISVEITEGVLLLASDRVAEKLLEYRDAGMQVALDDFGTGYASMSYLQRFQIDYVKIDQSFVRDMTSNASSRTIAETIIVMAHKLGQKVIAEGVETREQCDYLAAAGCDYGQGYLFSRPVPADKLMQMLSVVPPSTHLVG